MPDFYASSAPMPLDQADGLRRMFAARQTQLLPLVANPHLRAPSVLLDRLAEVLASQGLQVLVVDAGAQAPPPPELVQLGLAPCIEMISPRVAYLPARQLPVRYVDTRGCAESFIDALQQAWPQADVIVLHAEVSDLARLLKHRASRPLLLAADDPESLKHAYGSCKWLVQRCGLMTYDLLLAARGASPRLPSIAASLASCADQFLGAVVRNCALVDPAVAAEQAADADLLQLLRAQMNIDHTGLRAAPTGATTASSRRAERARTTQAWALAAAEPFPTHTAY
jgi:flagellar biosynthesis protein FlhG